MNDLNILNQSPLLKKMTDGSFSALERESRVVPFSIIMNQDFDKLFMLVDGIYPKFSRFVRG
jgi:Plant transposon protein